MKTLKRFSNFVFLVCMFLVVSNKPVFAGIYGCIWNPTNAPGQQCMLDANKLACNDNQAPGICDFPDEATCNNYNGACLPITQNTMWGCGADGKCTMQNGGAFANEAECKSFCIPKVMYNCINPTGPIRCQQVFTQSGQYTTSTECNTKCVPPPPSGNGNVLCTDNASIYTAIGCVPFSSITTLTGFFVTWGIGIGGGWATLLLIYAGVLIVTSGGNPSKLQAGKELLVSAISGILMLIFSVFLLRLIGVNVLSLF